MGLLGSMLGNMMGKGGNVGAQGAALNTPDAKSLLSGTGGGGMGNPSGVALPPPAAAMRGPMSKGGPSGGMTPGPQGPNMLMQGQGQSLGGKPMLSPIKEAAGSMGMMSQQPNTMQGMMGGGKQGGLLQGLMQPSTPTSGVQPTQATPQLLGSKDSKLLANTGIMPQQPTQPNKGALPENINNLLTQGMKQSEPGLQKLVSSLNPISTAQGSELGATSRKYESGKRGVDAMNPEALGKKGVDARGGPSYGQYQLASGPGTLQAYIKQSPYADDFKGLKPGTPAFNTKWKELAADPKFGQSQHDYIQKTLYDPARKSADKYGIANNPGVNDAIWSTSVQHGPGGANRIFAGAGIKPGDSPETQVNKIYNSRTAKFPAYKSRYMAERQDALKLAKGGELQPSNNPAVTQLQQAGYKPNVDKIARTELARNPLDAAQKYLGTSEHEGAPALKGFFKQAGIDIDPSKTPWCAAFVDATLKEGGMKGTGSLMAKSYLNWGTSTNNPRQGDVVVLSRGSKDGPQGHVGFYAGTEEIGGKQYVKILGGNQDDKVSVKSYPADRVLGFRKPPTNFADASKMVPALTDKPQTAMGPTETPAGQYNTSTPTNQSFAQNLLAKVFGGDKKSSGSSSAESSTPSMETASAPDLGSAPAFNLGQVLTPRRKMPAVVNERKKRIGEV